MRIPAVITPRQIVMPLVVLLCGALVLYPIGFLINESLNVGDPSIFPPEEYGLDNYTNLTDDYRALKNTLLVSCIATVLAVIFGFLQAWILTRTNIPGRQRLERLMELPYYMTPLIGALAWGVLLGPKTGLVNQVWRSTGAPGDFFDIYSPWGIAWVMALFEGTVAFVMISAAMKSMDPSLEESSRVLGAGKLRTALRITLPLVAPGVLSATIFVFAEMLGSFAAAFVLGIPGRFYVVTTVIWQATLSFPPDYGRAAAMGLSLFGVMLITLTLARLVLRHGTYTTITGKAFRPREMDVGRMRWPLLGIAWGYIIVAVILPLGALLLTSFERFATVILPQMQFTLANYETALQMGSVGPAFVNSLILGISVATIGVPVIGVLAWIIYRSRMPGAARRNTSSCSRRPCRGWCSVSACSGRGSTCRSRSTARCGCWRWPTSPCSCRSACAPSPASCCRSIRAWRNARASAARAGAIRCAPSPCRCCVPAWSRHGC